MTRGATLRLALVLVLGGGLRPLRAEEAGGGPVSLVLSYRARPESRAAFRSWLAGPGVGRLGAWKKSGLFQDYQVLFTSLAASGPVDAVVILDFARFSGLTAWEEVEKSAPGGLTPEALALAAPTNEAVADILSRAEPAGPDAATAYLITTYDVLTDPARYRKYALGYVVPQMQGWIAAGALAGYRLYLNQNPPGAPWGALLVLRYRDAAGLGRRESVKSQVREKLAASDPIWKNWSNDKTAIRKETAGFLATALSP